MTNFSPYGDTPNQILNEGIKITLTRTNTSASTVNLSWNIPEPYADNCVDGRRAYDGIILTVNTERSLIEDAPVSGQAYTADPTADSNLHAGSKLGNSMVIGAFYGDVTTISLDVSDVNNSTPLFFSAYAVTKELEYHIEGVHSYEETYGFTATEDAAPGFHQVFVGWQTSVSPFDINQFNGHSSGVRGGDNTGLLPATNYTFSIKSDLFPEETEVTIAGDDAQTYDELVDAINDALKQLHAGNFSAGPPNAGSYYYNIPDLKLFSFDGVSHLEIEHVASDIDPTAFPVGDYWFDSTLNILNRRNGTPGWDGIPYLTYHKLPEASEFNCDDHWIDSDDNKGYEWEGTTWCELPLITVDPTIPPDLPFGTYWYDEVEQLIKRFDACDECWKPIEALYTDQDPTSIPDGFYWYNDTDGIMYERVLGAWVDSGILVSDEEPSNPANGFLWYAPTLDEFTEYNSTLDIWVEITTYVVWSDDPTVQETCDLWWDAGTDVLNVWNVIDSVWEPVVSFIQSEIDPSLLIVHAVGTLYYNGMWVTKWDGVYWNNVSHILSDSDPLIVALDDHWFTGNVWYNYDGAVWNVIDVLYHDFDPSIPTTGSFWFNTLTNALSQWNGAAWTAILYSASPLTPVVGFIYYDTVAAELYIWNGQQYIVATPFVQSALNEGGNLLFLSSTVGSSSYVCVIEGDLFASLTENVRFDDPRVGEDKISEVPTYQQHGVGTDGSTDERRELIDTIRAQLGWPVVEVELTRQQFDLCVDGAIESLRKRSAIGYKRVMFFLDLEAYQQVYELKSEAVGFNKVVDVLAAYRVQSSFLGNATGQGAYGQAMLQHLYQMGSFDLISYYAVSQYVELMNEMFAANLTFHWDEQTRKLFFHQTFGSTGERLLLDCSIERTEQDLIMDRWTKTWIERYSMGSAKLLLAQIRGKYAALPGAGGGVSLNAQELQVQGEADIENCWQQIEEYLVNDPENWGYESGFLLG